MCKQVGAYPFKENMAKREVLDENWILWEGTRFPRCQGLNGSGKQCKRIAKKGFSTCGKNHGSETTDLGLKAVGQEPVPFNKFLEDARKDLNTRDFSEYISRVVAMIRDIEYRSEKIGLTADDAQKIANFCDLATKLIERESKVRLSDKYLMSIDEVRSVINQVVFAVNSVCPACPHRNELIMKLKEVKIGNADFRPN
jgi:hypothetical protein